MLPSVDSPGLFSLRLEGFNHIHAPAPTHTSFKTNGSNTSCPQRSSAPSNDIGAVRANTLNIYVNDNQSTQFCGRKIVYRGKESCFMSLYFYLLHRSPLSVTELPWAALNLWPGPSELPLRKHSLSAGRGSARTCRGRKSPAPAPTSQKPHRHRRLNEAAVSPVTSCPVVATPCLTGHSGCFCGTGAPRLTRQHRHGKVVALHPAPGRPCGAGSLPGSHSRAAASACGPGSSFAYPTPRKCPGQDQTEHFFLST